jgi:hypothetical protein
MKLRAISLILVPVLLAGALAAADKPEPPKVVPSDTTAVPAKPDSASTVKTSDHKVIAYYFHGNRRCISCRKIEAFTKEAIDSAFGGDLKSGALEWRVVNTDSAQNEHYWTDYKLYTKSVILSDLHGGKETRWKNLEKVWEFLGDQKEFAAYISSELKAFMDPTK